ncbi:hypothetical protein [Nocardia tengchongensis]
MDIADQQIAQVWQQISDQMLDTFSRKVIHHTAVPRDSQWIAKQFQLDAIAANDGIVPDHVHADNGGR